MEGGPNAIQGKTNPRSAALVPFRSQRHQQRFYIRPVDVGPNRVGKDGAERFLMFADHGLMISDNSIMSSGDIVGIDIDNASTKLDLRELVLNHIPVDTRTIAA